MNRAELKRVQREQKKKSKTFTLTQEQIDAIKESSVKEATERAFILMLTIPLEVLITEEYWKDSAKDKIPKFINDLLTIYKAYEEDNLSLEEMKEDLLEFAGIKI